jgi:23S rRNA pseudouridine2605 synthase
MQKSPQRKESELHRLNKLLSERGVTSRRMADKWIEEGRVQVNGKTVYELGKKVDPSKDRITIDHKPLPRMPKKVYFVFNKPKGVLTTLQDPEGRPTLADFLSGIKERVFPVGRLDWDSEGLLILTNDGELAKKIMHPRYEIPKTYLVKLDHRPDPEKFKRLLKGVTIKGGRVKALLVQPIGFGKKKSQKYSWVKIVITEGKNRQIRQMFAKIDCDVLKLQRVAIGRLTLGSLAKGEIRTLSSNDIKKIFVCFNGDAAAEVPKRKNIFESRLRRGSTRVWGRTGRKPAQSV